MHVMKMITMLLYMLNNVNYVNIYSETSLRLCSLQEATTKTTAEQEGEAGSMIQPPREGTVKGSVCFNKAGCTKCNLNMSEGKSVPNVHGERD